MKTRKAKHIFHTDIWHIISCFWKVGNTIATNVWTSVQVAESLIFHSCFSLFDAFIGRTHVRHGYVVFLVKSNQALEIWCPGHTWFILHHQSCQFEYANILISGVLFPVLLLFHIWMFPKMVGFSPQIIHFNRVFPLFSPSSLGVFPIFGNTHIYLVNSRWPLWDCESSRDPNATDQWLER